MVEPGAALTRRQLLSGSLAGVVAGGAWGAAIQSLAKPSAPTVSLIGAGASQIALVDTIDLRVLILLGPVSDGLVDAIPMLLTMVRQRLDIVVGPAATIEHLPAGFTSRWRVAHTFVIPAAGAATPATRTQTSVVDDFRLEPGNGVELVIRRSTRADWQAHAETQQLWTVTTTFDEAALVFAPDMASVDVLAERGPAVLAVPKGEVGHIARRWSPAAIAVNARDELDAAPGTMLVRIHPGEVARFTIRDGQVALPPWAITGS